MLLVLVILLTDLGVEVLFCLEGALDAVDIVPDLLNFALFLLNEDFLVFDDFLVIKLLLIVVCIFNCFF